MSIFSRALLPATTTLKLKKNNLCARNIRLKQAGRLPRERGSTKRPYEQSWQYAFQNFDLTKQILTEVPLEIRTEPMESEGFSNWIRNQNNLWIYASNITQFHYFDLEFANPTNVVVVRKSFIRNNRSCWIWRRSAVVRLKSNSKSHSEPNARIEYKTNWPSSR